MRKSTFAALMIVGATVLILLPAVTTGQFQFQQGGKGNKGGTKGAGGFSDPGVVFDYLAKNRSFFLITETTRSRDQLMQFAQERGITNGQITRQQYVDFTEWTKTKLTGGANQGGAGGGPGGFPGKGPGGGGPGMFPGGGPGGDGPPREKKGFGGGGPAPGTPLDPAVVNDFADREFKRADNNGDGRLNKDEMSNSLLAALSRWDKNGDTMIDQTEFREYYMARMQGNDGNPGRAIATIVIEDDELERKAVVYKAGNLPRNIPSWFKDLDADSDGQIALYEWRAGKKAIEEFGNWDLNDDGFIIPEEAMRTQDILAKNTTRGSGGSSEGGSMSGGFSGGKGDWGGKKGGFGGFGGGNGETPQFGQGGFGGFGGFGKKGDGGFGKKGGGDSSSEPPSMGKKGRKGG